MKGLGLGGGRAAKPDLPVEDLIAMGRFEEAEQFLRHRLQRRPADLRSQTLLGDVLRATDRPESAESLYLTAADRYAEDGFHDRAIAVLGKLRRLNPEDTQLAERIARLNEAKRLGEKRAAAVRGLLKSRRGGAAELGGRAMQVERLWENLSESAFVRALDVEQTQRFFTHGRLARHDRGAMLRTTGEDRPEAILLLEGSVEVRYAAGRGRRRVLGELGVGDLFGEQALLERRPWPAEYVANEDLMGVFFDREALERTLAGNPNPRALLDALRSQSHDANVLRHVDQIRGESPS